MEQQIHKVLIIEDEPAVALLLRAAIEPRFDSIVANDAERALQILKTEPIDAIMTDINLPNMDGVEFVVSLSDKRSAPKPIPIAVVTGIDPGDLRLQVLKEIPSVYCVIPKPFSVERLEQLLNCMIVGDVEGARQLALMSALQ